MQSSYVALLEHMGGGGNMIIRVDYCGELLHKLSLCELYGDFKGDYTLA